MVSLPPSLCRGAAQSPAAGAGALIPQLHHRASLWYEQHEMFAERPYPTHWQFPVSSEMLIRALALQAQGDQAGAISALDRALVLAEPETPSRSMSTIFAANRAFKAAYKLSPKTGHSLFCRGAEQLRV